MRQADPCCSAQRHLRRCCLQTADGCLKLSGAILNQSQKFAGSWIVGRGCETPLYQTKRLVKFTAFVGMTSGVAKCVQRTEMCHERNPFMQRQDRRRNTRTEINSRSRTNHITIRNRSATSCEANKDRTCRKTHFTTVETGHRLQHDLETFSLLQPMNQTPTTTDQW